MSDCIRFKGHIRKQDGYGIISRTKDGRQKIFMAHRWKWAEAHDKDPWTLPSWVRIKQTCGDHACVNPDHLLATTQDSTYFTLPDAGEGVEWSKADVLMISAVDSPAAAAQRARQLCVPGDKGHAFRTEPDDTPCIACKVQKQRDITYGITTVPAN